MIRPPLRQCGKPYPTEADAARSKAGQRPGVQVTRCWACGRFHVTAPAVPVSRTVPLASVKPAGTGRKTSSSGKITPPEPSEFSRKLPDYLTAYARARVEIKPDGCWYWTGPVNPKGYGVANLPGGKREGAHQHVFYLSGGVVADGMVLDHQCHNRDEGCRGGIACLHRRCVNPAHLEEATRGDNACRGKGSPALNLAKEKCPRGHDYDYTDKRGWRKCSKCERINETARRRAAGVPEHRSTQGECSKGHEFTPENTYIDPKGHRSCKTCRREILAASRAKRRKPCRGCGGVTVGGSAKRYCAKCLDERVVSDFARKTKSSGEFPGKMKLAVRARAGNGLIEDAQCESCGKWCGRYGGQIQHRISRGMGGSSHPAIRALANATLLCGTPLSGCHGLAERRDPEMNARGFWLQHGQGPAFDPRYVPIMLHGKAGGGMTVWLAADGIGDDGTGYLFASPLIAASVAAITEDDAAGLVPSLRTGGNQ